MKYLYIKIAVVLSAVVSLSSCDSFLDETPDNRLRLNSYETIAELVTNAYPEGSGVFMEWMSDNVGADPKNIQRSEMTQAYNWQDVEQEGQDTPSFYWSGNYKAIAHANQALEALEEVKENNSDIVTTTNILSFILHAFNSILFINLIYVYYLRRILK